MRCRIHRGSEEIGGSCVELEQDGQRLVLDLGRPLASALSEPLPLPSIEGLDGAESSLQAVIISHGHPDHYGLADSLGDGVPVFVGEATERILREALFFSPAGIDLRVAGHLADRTPLRLGAFTVTPYLADHSAFDAYSLLVEAAGRRLFYSADIRGHGRKSTFERLLAAPPQDVHVTLLEGTRVAVEGTRDDVTEQDLEGRLIELMRETPGLVLAAYSAQNIDRLVTLYRAAKRSGRMLVMDLYAAAIARATGRTTIPQADWDHVRVYVPQSQQLKVKRTREFGRVAELGRQRIYTEELASRPQDFVVTFRASMTRELERAHCLKGASLAWSMWPGYLSQPGMEPMNASLALHDIITHQMHSSGHATVEDLQRLARCLGGRIVPIHTSAPARFVDLFPNVERHGDGEWWRV